MFPDRFSHELQFYFDCEISHFENILVLGISEILKFRRIRDGQKLTIAFPASSFSSISAIFAFNFFAELSISALQGFKLIQSS